MSWVELSYDEKIEIYKEIFKEQIESPRNPDLAIFDMMVNASILQHDFTKRQLVIIKFIMTLSFGFQKREALIPKLQDFELAGISKKKIKDELKKLIDMNVVNWNKDENLFSITDPRKWDTVPYNVGYNIPRSRELFYLNIVHAGIDIKPLLQKREELK